MGDLINTSLDKRTPDYRKQADCRFTPTVTARVLTSDLLSSMTT